MASTVLPNGIIIPEKFSRDWYNDLYHNWQELDNLLGGGTPKDGTLTIQKNGTAVGTFSANQATDETLNITVPDVNDATLTIQQNGTTVDTFTANSSSDKTVNIQCVDLSSAQTVAGNKEFTGTTTAHDVVPSATNTYNFGSPSVQWNNAYTRNILIDNDINIASSLISKTSNSGVLTVRGGISDAEGASLSLYGKDYGGSPGLIGNIYMTAYGNSDYTNFRIYPNGIIRVYNNSTATTKNVAMQEDTVPRSGGAVMTGNFLGRDTNGDSFNIHGGTGSGDGASIILRGRNTNVEKGYMFLHVEDFSVGKSMILTPDGTWTWNGTAVQLISDQRLKQQISEIDDKLLDAWEDVELLQFKYNDAVDAKKDKARLHTGYVVQQIDSACKSHGVDVSAYGLFCHE